MGSDAHTTLCDLWRTTYGHGGLPCPLDVGCVTFHHARAIVWSCISPSATNNPEAVVGSLLDTLALRAVQFPPHMLNLVSYALCERVRPLCLRDERLTPLRSPLPHGRRPAAPPAAR